MKLFLLSFFLIFSFTLSFSQKKILTEQDTLRGSLTNARTCFDVTYYDLSVQVDVTKRRIRGANKIYFYTTTNVDSIQIDLFENMLIKQITDVQGNKLTYKRKGNATFVYFTTTLVSAINTFICVDYEGEPSKAVNPPWDGGFVWTLDSLERPWASTACEGIGASLWWPCKDHPSDEPDSMTFRAEVSPDLYAISNGNLKNTEILTNGNKRYTWHIGYPINLYNVCLNIGYYELITDKYVRADGSSLSLEYYILSYNKSIAQAHFAQVKTILKCYEYYFGNYPFERDGYALVETPFWGMEHQSAIAYGNKFKNNMLGKLDYIIVHETGHEWWGNNVTAADHADLWIHEAFTTYGESLLVEYLYGKEAAQAYLVSQKKFIRNREAILGPYGVNYHYWQDSDMYYKGAWMLHTLRQSVQNDSLWFALIKTIQVKYALKSIHTKELITYINQFLGKEYTGFFKQYLAYADLPKLEYHISKKGNKRSVMSYRWKTNVKDFYLPIELKISKGEKITINPSTKTQEITIPGSQQPLFDANKYYILLEKTP